MKKALVSMGLTLLMLSVLCISPVCAGEEWPGVDEAVVKKFAEQSGRPAREPFINTAQGDLLLFCFLVAGTVGGFVMGYHCRALFPPTKKQAGN